MKKVMLLVSIALFYSFLGAAPPQESTLLRKEDLRREMLPAKFPQTANPLDAFRRIRGRMLMREVVELCGLPVRDIGSGIHIYVYELADGSEVRVGTPDGKRVLYVVHVLESGEVQELLRVKSTHKRKAAARHRPTRR